LAEQQQTAKQIEQRKLEQKKVREWKQKLQENQESSFDLFAVLPGPVIIAIDRFLKTGLAITTFAFVLGGFAIVLEAWSKTSGEVLPEDIQNFIVNIVEPNFTFGLVVLLTFSISLGIFAALQLGSEGATYREKD
jgi:ABC-type dipeptide/oligopeptide/nickel transport system permease component